MGLGTRLLDAGSFGDRVSAEAASTSGLHVSREGGCGELDLPWPGTSNRVSYAPVRRAVDGGVNARQQASLESLRTAFWYGSLAGQRELPDSYDRLLAEGVLMAQFDEANTTQAAIVERLSQPDLGWTFIAGDELPRTTESVLIVDHLVDALATAEPGYRGGS